MLFRGAQNNCCTNTRYIEYVYTIKDIGETNINCQQYKCANENSKKTDNEQKEGNKKEWSRKSEKETNTETAGKSLTEKPSHA